MNKAYRPVWTLLMVIVALAAVTVMMRSSGKEKVPWRTDLTNATIEAQQSGKPLLVYFTAEWCAPCQHMKTTTWADGSVEQALRAYVPVKVDIDLQPKLKERFGVDSLPRFIVLDGAGNRKKDQTGGMEPGEFLKWLNG